MPKPAKLNGFAILLFDIRKEYRLSTKDSTDKADGIWRSLSPQEKEVYNRRAKEANNRALNRGENDHLLPMEQRIELENMVTATLALAEADDEIEMLKVLMKENVVDFPFIFVSVNHFVCNKNHYVPAELGMARFTLNDGIIDNMHYFFKHRLSSLPVRELPNMLSYSKEFHNIPLNNHEHIIEQWDSQVLVQKVFNYIHYNHEPRSYVFAIDEEVEQTRQYFEYMQGLSKQFNEKRFHFKVVVLKLSTLYAHLYKRIHERPPPNVNEALMTFKSSKYLYYGLCPFHEALANPNCAVARVQNFCWLICDTLCPGLDITAVKGHHLPDDIINPI